MSADRSALSSYEQFAATNRKKEECSKVTGALRNYLRASFVFDPIPGRMRSYERVTDVVLNRTGSNLSAVLYALYKGDENQRNALERLRGWISQLPDEPYTSFDFVETELGDVLFGLCEGENTRLVDARLLSDGTLRCLAVLTALETVHEGSRVIIEEFDNGLHPSRVRVLAEALADCCKRRKLNVLVTTHNPATLNALLPEQLDGVVLCTWDPTEKASRLVPLPEVPRLPELLEQGCLGDLVTRRVFERYLAPKVAESNKSWTKEWLQSLP